MTIPFAGGKRTARSLYRTPEEQAEMDLLEAAVREANGRIEGADADRMKALEQIDAIHAREEARWPS